MPKYFRSPEYVIIFKKEFFTKVFWVESFHLWKSLIWLKVEQSPSSHQKNSITKNHLTETASFTRGEKSPNHQKRRHSKSLDPSIYSKGPSVLPKLTFPRSAPSHLLLTTELKKLYPGLCFILLLPSNLQFLKAWTYEGRGNACPSKHFTMNCTVMSVSESHAHLFR